MPANAVCRSPHWTSLFGPYELGQYCICFIHAASTMYFIFR